MAIAGTVTVPAEAHAACGSSTQDSKHSICSNCKKPHHMSEFCIQPGSGMAGKTIAEAQQAHNVKCGKKPKDKSKDISKGTAGSIIQSGNHAYIVNTAGNTHKIISSTSSMASASTTTDSMHFLQMDDLASIDPLVLDSMCTADDMG